MKLTLRRLALGLSCLAVTFSQSCKKNEQSPTDADEIGKMKEWFTDQSRSSKSEITSSAGLKVALLLDPAWDTPKVIINEDQTTALAFKVKTNLYSYGTLKGELVLIIQKKDNEYSSRLVSVAQPKVDVGTVAVDYNKLFNDSFGNVDDSEVKMRNITVSLSDATFRNLHMISAEAATEAAAMRRDYVKNQAKQMTVTCFDYILTTNYYADGVWIGSSEQFLGRYCTGNAEGVQPEDGGGGGSGGGDNNCAEALAPFQASVTDRMEYTTTEMIDAVTRKQDYHWTIYEQNQGLWKFTSHEIATHYLDGNTWKFQSLTHEGISQTGFVTGGTVSVTLNTAVATVGVYNALMSLNCTFHAGVSCAGIPMGWSTDFPAKKTFNVND